MPSTELLFHGLAVSYPGRRPDLASGGLRQEALEGAGGEIRTSRREGVVAPRSPGRREEHRLIAATRAFILVFVEILGTRAKTQPPPSHVVFEALMSPNLDPARQWLQLLDDEVLPRITESVSPTLVVWSSIWVKRPAAQIRFDIEGDVPGCHLRWTLLDAEDPGPALVGHMCKRLNVLINAELRYSFGQ